jgi:hypothetical protein
MKRLDEFDKLSAGQRESSPYGNQSQDSRAIHFEQDLLSTESCRITVGLRRVVIRFLLGYCVGIRSELVAAMISSIVASRRCLGDADSKRRKY